MSIKKKKIISIMWSFRSRSGVKLLITPSSVRAIYISGPVKTNSFILYYRKWPLDFISWALRAYFLLSDSKRKKSPISLSVSKEWTSIKSYEDFLEDPLAALSGPLWNCRSDSSGERKTLCRESQTPDLEKKRHIYHQSQTDCTDFNSSYKQDSGLKI